MNLIIDIGNTRVKLAVFEDEKIKFLKTFKEINIKKIDSLLVSYNQINKVILSTVRNDNEQIESFLSKRLKTFIKLDHNTSIPIANNYKTKETLGKDRLAGVIGANKLFPHSNNLVIDLGTAITFDFIFKEEYKGGNISPGIETRFKALNTFTKKLPLLEKTETCSIIGTNTNEAIISGVINGIIFEIDGYIDNFKADLKKTNVILTGGDSVYFKEKLKNKVFLEENLVLIGLNTILKHND